MKTQTTDKNEIAIKIEDIYIRNGTLTADAMEYDPVSKKSSKMMFNMGVGGKYAQAVMDYMRKIAA